MDKQYWLDKWEISDIGFNQPKPHHLLTKYFGNLSLKPKARVFVPLCGKSIDILWLLEAGYQVVGIEISDIACEDFFKEHRLSYKASKQRDFMFYQGHHITLICGDFFGLTQDILGPVDAVYDRAALIALPSQERKQYAAHMIQLTPSNAQLFLITLKYTQAEFQGPPFSVSTEEVNMLYQKHLEIEFTHCAEIRKIAPHLQTKGLKKAFEEVHIMRKI